MSTMKEKMHTGDMEIMTEQIKYQDLLCEYNLTKPSEFEKREDLLKRVWGNAAQEIK